MNVWHEALVRQRMALAVTLIQHSKETNRVKKMLLKHNIKQLEQLVDHTEYMASIFE